MCGVGRAAAVRIDARRPERHLGAESRYAQRLPQVRQKKSVSEPAKVALARTSGKNVTHSGGGDGRRGGDRGLKKGRVEAENLRPVGAGSLREEKHRHGKL